MRTIILTIILFISVSLPVYGDGFSNSSLKSSIFALFSFALVLVLAYFTTKFLSKNISKLNKSKNMKVLDIISIDNNNKIALVEILDVCYIISISNTGINVIDKLNNFENLDILEDNEKNKINSINKFESVLKSFSSLNKKQVYQYQNDNELTDKNLKLLKLKEKVSRLNRVDKDV